MSDDPASTGNPYTSYRRVTGGDGNFYLGGAYTTYVVARVFPGASGFGLWEQVDVKAQIDNGVIKGVTANGLQLQGAPLDLRRGPGRRGICCGRLCGRGADVQRVVVEVLVLIAAMSTFVLSEGDVLWTPC